MAARRGEPAACRAFAEQLFVGSDGFRQNFPLGLSYIREELGRDSPEAIKLVGQLIPVDVILDQDLTGVLIQGVAMGSTLAELKLGIWLATKTSSRMQGVSLINGAAPRLSLATGDLHEPHQLAEFLSLLPETIIRDKVSLPLTRLKDALATADLETASFCFRLAQGLGAQLPAIAPLIAKAVELAVRARPPLRVDLPTDLIEASLQWKSDAGDANAQFILGTALGGLTQSGLEWSQLVRRTNMRRAAALLLRAADAGAAEAWLNLHWITTDYRSSAANQEMAIFFLEKAAGAGLGAAQRKFGAFLLKQASCLAQAEKAVSLLYLAAESGDDPARKVLSTLFLPAPRIPAEFAEEIVSRVQAMDKDIGVRLRLAHIFRLTREETVHFEPTTALRPWGISLSAKHGTNRRGRAVPALNAQMKRVASDAADCFGVGQQAISLHIQRSRALTELFKELKVIEGDFFPPVSARQLDQYSFGPSWASRNASLVKAVLNRPGC